MKGIYFSVPDSEFNFYMSMLGRFKTATLIKTDDFKIDEHKLLPWQIEELNQAILEDDTSGDIGIEAKELNHRLRKKINV